jgi:hypothetical protein
VATLPSPHDDVASSLNGHRKEPVVVARSVQ